MAVLALGFIGSAIGGGIGGSILGVTASAIGGFIGAQVGGLIDNMLFAGTTKVQGPRLDDKRVMVSSYGSTIPRVWGPENRIAGTVIWSTGLIEDVHVEKQGGKGGPSVQTTSYTYRVSAALLLAEGPCLGSPAVSKIWANSKLIYDATPGGSPAPDKVIFGDLRVYPGDGSQMPDPLIESYVGVGDTPAYRHSCYCVIEDLQLADFGNRLPNLEFLLAAHPDPIVAGTVVENICTACGLDRNTISTSGIGNRLVRGYAITGSARGSDALQPLALCYAFDAAEQGGNLRFVRRGLAVRGTIEAAELGAFEGVDNEPQAEPIRFDLMPPVTMPTEAVISFTDPARDYQRNAQPSRRQFGDADSHLSYDLPIVIDVDEGRRVADRMLYEAWTSRRTSAFTSNERYRAARPGDCYMVASPAGHTRVRVTRLLRGANGLLMFESREDDPTIYTSESVGIAASVPAQTISAPGDTVLVLLDAPLLRDEDDGSGFYYAASGESSGWRGADLRRSADAGVTYNEVSPISRGARIGTVASGLPDGPSDYWDRANVLTVVLSNPDATLSSRSELEVLNGANVVWLGDPTDSSNGEILQFATATLIAPATYELSDLLRGRIGTEFATGLHGAGETFVILQTGFLSRADFGPADWNKSRLYKPVSVLGDETTTAAQAFTNTGEVKRPRSPVHVRGTRDVSNNLALTWIRRSRLREPGLGNGLVPLGEQVEAYEIDVYSGATVVRTISASTPSASYSAAEQTVDGLIPGDPVHVMVYQLSDVRGRGRAADATV